MDQTQQNIQNQLNHLDNIKRALRQREADLDTRKRYLDANKTIPAGNVQVMRQSMQGILPAYMMPGNVGGINEVTWPFYFQIEFDLGDDPTIADNIFTKNFFQVDQEAALLLMSVSRAHNTDAAGFSATQNAPLQMEIIDRQSSRRFESQPVPLQMIGFNSQPSILPTPMYIPPNDFIDVVINGIPSTGQDFTGSGKFQLSFFGYRIRTEDTNKILSTIFQAP